MLGFQETAADVEIGSDQPVCMVETSGLEPPTPCVQRKGWCVRERPRASTLGGSDAHALSRTAPVATTVATTRWADTGGVARAASTSSPSPQ